MTRVVCGWCMHPTDPAICGYCGRDPALPWSQRGRRVPTIAHAEPGRPPLDENEIRRRYEEARHRLLDTGREVTIEALAELLDRSPRTVREWRQRFGL